MTQEHSSPFVKTVAPGYRRIIHKSIKDIFLIQYSGEPIPIEVKAEENLQAKSLKTFCQKYAPKTAIRTSMSDYRQEDWLTNLPLYAVGEIAGLV